MNTYQVQMMGVKTKRDIKVVLGLMKFSHASVFLE